MLHSPHLTYTRIYLYILDKATMPVISDPDYIGGWVDDSTILLLFHCQKNELIASLCKQHGCSVIYQADMDYKDWENGEAIQPFTVQGLTVAPVWHNGPANIILDPSVIFGNGFHPTTRLCLEALLTLLRQKPAPLFKALDLGCGTGLLALAAAHCGVQKVIAMDYNPFACEVARANAQRNGLEHQMEVLESDLLDQTPDTRVDVIMANLHLDLLQKLFQDDTFWQARFYIFSGFFTHQEEKLLGLVPTEKVRFLLREKKEKWAVWVFEAKKEHG